jgi:hypothetical protein
MRLMLIAEMLPRAAGQDGGFSVTQLWLIAIGTFIASAVAFGTLPLSTPGTRTRMGAGARAVVAPLPPLGAALFCFVASAMHGDDQSTGLQLYIAAMLPLVVLRIILAKWLKRAGEKYIRDAGA